MSDPSVYSLNVHAAYACKRSGVCCTSGWSIPVEPRLRPSIGRERIIPLDSGACPEFEPSGRSCQLHRRHGEDALPESCYQFPRRALIDERGTFVTLSHFCPTAATLLVDAGEPLQIVEHPPAFPRARRYDGLDARQEWSPLVRPEVLFDHPSYAQWEGFLVSRLGKADAGVAGTLGQVAWTAERLRLWTPDRGSLRGWTASVLARHGDGPSPELGRSLPEFYSFCNATEAYELALAAVPASLARPTWPTVTDSLAEADATLVTPVWDAWRKPVLRYVGSKAFGAWSAYDGRGVRTQVAELILSAAVLRVECARACADAGQLLGRDLLIRAVRAADWLLIHLLDRSALMARLREVEAHAPVQLHA